MGSRADRGVRSLRAVSLRARRITELVVLTLAITSCASAGTGPLAGPSQGSAGRPAATSSDPGPRQREERTLRAFFEAYAADTAADTKRLAHYAAPGSPAALYARYRAAYREAEGDPDPEDLRIDGRTAVLTREEIGEEGKTSTVTISGVEFDGEGRIVTWTSDPGGPLAARIVRMPRTIAEAGVTLAFSVADQSAVGGLVLSLRITNRTAKDASVRSDTYIQPDGRQLDDLRGVNSIPFAPDVSAGAYVLDLVVIEGGKLGGTLVVDLNNYQRKVRVKVPRP